MEKIISALTSDKAMHFLYSHLIAALSLALIGWWGLAIPIWAGLAKEAVDQYCGSGWDKWDLVADAAGIAVAAVAYILLTFD